MYPNLGEGNPTLTKISTNDYKFIKIKNDKEEFNRQKVFDKKYDQCTVLLNELKKRKIKI